MASLDEQLQATKDSERAKQLEDLKQRQRRQKNLARAATVGSLAAQMAGQEELAELLGEGAHIAKEGARGGDPGATRRAASNFGGRVAGAAARGNEAGGKRTANALGGNLSAGQAAALGGAVSGALQGRGAVGVAQSAGAWYVLNFAFGFLTIGSFTLVGFIGALIYLDVHYIVSKITKGRGFFINMSLWQKIVLAIANLVAAIIPLAFVLLVYSATCGNSLVSWGSKLTNVVTLGYIKDICNAFGGTAAGRPSRSGGGGGGGGWVPWEPADLVALSGVTVDPQASDPRVRSCMLGKVQQIFSAAQASGLNVAITSAFRGGDFPSRHAYGEAVDIALRPLPAQPWGSNSKIARLVQISRDAGFASGVGDTIDEYNRPVERTSGGHIHIEFNKKVPDESYCGPYPNTPAPFS